MSMNDAQYISHLEAMNEAQNGEINLLQSDLTETRKMVKTVCDTNANLTVTLEELRLKNTNITEFYNNSGHKDGKLTDKDKEALKRIMETNERLEDQVEQLRACCKDCEEEEANLNRKIEREAGYKASLFGLIYLQRAMLDILCDKEPLLDPKEIVHHIMDRWEIDRLEG